MKISLDITRDIKKVKLMRLKMWAVMLVIITIIFLMQQKGWAQLLEYYLLRPVASKEKIEELSPQEQQIWVERISDAITVPPSYDSWCYVLFGNDIKDEMDYVSAVLERGFIDTYDNLPPEKRYKKIYGGVIDRGIKVELPRGFTARFVTFDEPREHGSGYHAVFGIVIHKGYEEVARISCSKTQIPWLEVKKGYRNIGIAKTLIQALIAILKKDSVRWLSVSCYNQATLVILWDLGFQWHVGQIGLRFNREEIGKFKKTDAEYMRLIQHIIDVARVQPSAEARREIYLYLCNGQSNSKLGIKNEDGIIFSGEGGFAIQRVDGFMDVDLGLTTSEAINVRNKIIGLPEKTEPQSSWHILERYI